MAETSYTTCGDLSLAYQVFGDGPIELVFVGPIFGHTELFWKYSRRSSTVRLAKHVELATGCELTV
jgi:hypothetical protein